jgi:ABC-type Mn2+/Zn2+ transport system ATPase subunit
MRLDSVGKRYGVRQPWVIRDVSADVAPGTLIRLEGRNGSGKSTLLRVAAGVSLPSRGKVTGRLRTGYVPERFPGALPFTGRGYLLHMARVHGLRGAVAASRVDGWLERLGAAGYADQPLRALSKGMCQKIAITQALLPQPGLLVLDEAWTGLDQAARGALDAAALERVADGGTVMFVDHEQARLPGKISEHWRLDGSGRVSVVPGGPDSPAPSGPAADTAVAAADTAVAAADTAVAAADTAVAAADTVVADGAVIVIELDGLEGDSAVRLRDLPGVITAGGVSPSVVSSGAVSPDVVSGAGATVRVATGRSDDLLRQVLTWDGVHVVSVRAEKTVRAEKPAGKDAGR